MNFKTITSSDELWCKVRNYAESYSWGAGKALANAMDNNGFNDWERVIIAVDRMKKFVVIVQLQKQTVFQMWIIHLILALCLLVKNIEAID